ncbi:hypothetical protein Tco_1408619 [Tanacetum coccineum]
MYLVFSQLLKSFDREDLVELYKLVKTKYGSTRLVEDMDLLLWGDLKTMFEPHVEDEIWKLQQRYKVLSWKLFDSCGVHCLSLQSGMIYMLVEKRYPLILPTITDMLNKKFQLKELDLLKWDQQVSPLPAMPQLLPPPLRAYVLPPLGVASPQLAQRVVVLGDIIYARRDHSRVLGF